MAILRNASVINHVAAATASMALGRNKERGAVPQNYFVNNVAALDATESPKIAASTVARKIDAHFTGHFPAAPLAVRSARRMCGSPRCLKKHRFHITPA